MGSSSCHCAANAKEQVEYGFESVCHCSRQVYSKVASVASCRFARCCQVVAFVWPTIPHSVQKVMSAASCRPFGVDAVFIEGG
eukprot:4805244-Karenia_brevis.AAC.1